MRVPLDIEKKIEYKIKLLEDKGYVPRYLIISRMYEKYFKKYIENSKTLWAYAKFKIPVRYKNLELLVTDKENIIEVY